MKHAIRCLLVCFALSQTSHLRAAETVDFATDIAPILQQHCLRCHSDENDKGDLSLSTNQHVFENEYVIPGDAAASPLIDLVTSTDGEPPEMPKKGDPLNEQQVSLLRKWIDDGAKWPKDVILKERSKADSSWWSLQPLKQTTLNSIDEYIQAGLAKQNLSMNPEADRRTLIRRATYDLTGLPPTPEQVKAFTTDPATDAYERLVDRLLDSHHYGERWGRHWLDVVRFGESIGYERNVIINNLWPFRDYVIRSINEDKPFDRFIKEHIAGDALGHDHPEVVVGSAFLVAGPYDDVGNQDAAQAAQIRANTIDEMIRATSEAFLGITVGCARCHDHKFDPILQADYYSMYSTFAGIRHGAMELASHKEKTDRANTLKPLNEKRAKLEEAKTELHKAILERGRERLAEHEKAWTRPAVTRTGTEERFEPVTTKFVRLICEARDDNPNAKSGFGIDEFEIWSSETKPRNVALASNGTIASGAARKIEDFPGAYGPQLAIDGETGARFLATGRDLTIELAEPTLINRIVFSSAKNERKPQQPKFKCVAEYRIEISDDGSEWQEIANGESRKPTNDAHLNWRLEQLETTAEDKSRQRELNQQLAETKQSIAAVPGLPSVWIGRRDPNDAKGPFHVFTGGNPQKKGEAVTTSSLAVFADAGLHSPNYSLPATEPEAGRRTALAEWMVNAKNPLTPRVLANRIWHYHFGTGIVSTPSDFGYMGSKPSHPELLDFLANELLDNGWRLKPLHKQIMMSHAYRQSSAYRDGAAKTDSESRLLWRFPPRRLSAEEIRDTILCVSGKLPRKPDQGAGFRLYHFMQDNVCTYVPLDSHGPDTYRRAVYHQNARASVVDLMTEFDQPDCTFSAPKRAATTTPLQALTMFNHSFTMDMANALATRIESDADSSDANLPQTDSQIHRAYELCYSREATTSELESCRQIIVDHGLPAFCRVLLNTSELIYVK